MTTRRALLVTVLLLFPLQCVDALAQCRKRGSTHEQILRTRARKTSMPVYPAQAAKEGARGVAVAVLNVDEAGEVTGVEVIQAPHPLIKKAVSEAAMRWEFEPLGVGGQPICVQGKMTFYFDVDTKGQGLARNPKIYQ